MSSTSMAIIGDGSVGKSAIINAFKAEGFLSTYIQTVGFQVYEKRLQLRGDTFVSLQLWDIGGQSINSKNLENYLASAKIVLLVYDTTNLESFLNIEDWLVIARKYTAKASLYLVGNKIDLIALRQIPQNQHDQYIIENNLKGGFFFSAKTGENVLKGFYQAAGDSVGLNLSQQELAYYDKLVKAHVCITQDNEGRTPFADEIEAEDRAALEKSKKRGCVCS